MLKKGDKIFFILLVLVIITGVVYVNFYKNNDAGDDKTAIIKHDNKVIRSINLDTVRETEIINIHGDYNLSITVEMGRIRFHEADCPDRICVKTGWLESRGDTAVCLPNRSIITIVRKANNVDTISY